MADLVILDVASAAGGEDSDSDIEFLEGPALSTPNLNSNATFPPPAHVLYPVLDILPPSLTFGEATTPQRPVEPSAVVSIQPVASQPTQGSRVAIMTDRQPLQDRSTGGNMLSELVFPEALATAPTLAVPTARSVTPEIITLEDSDSEMITTESTEPVKQIPTAALTSLSDSNDLDAFNAIPTGIQLVPVDISSLSLDAPPRPATDLDSSVATSFSNSNSVMEHLPSDFPPALPPIVHRAMSNEGLMTGNAPTVSSDMLESGSKPGWNVPPILQVQNEASNEAEVVCLYDEPPTLLPEIAVTRRHHGIVKRRNIFGEIVNSEDELDSMGQFGRSDQSPLKKGASKCSSSAKRETSKPGKTNKMKTGSIRKSESQKVHRSSPSKKDKSSSPRVMKVRMQQVTNVSIAGSVQRKVVAGVKGSPLKTSTAQNSSKHKSFNKRCGGPHPFMRPSSSKKASFEASESKSQSLQRMGSVNKTLAGNLLPATSSVQNEYVPLSTGWKSAVPLPKPHEMSSRCGYAGICGRTREAYTSSISYSETLGPEVAGSEKAGVDIKFKEAADGIFSSPVLNQYMLDKSSITLSFPAPGPTIPYEPLPAGEVLPCPSLSVSVPQPKRSSREPYFKTLLEKQVWMGLRDVSDLKKVSGPPLAKDPPFSEAVPLYSLLRPPRYLAATRSRRHLVVPRAGKLLPLAKVLNSSHDVRRRWDAAERRADCIQYVYHHCTQLKIRGSENHEGSPSAAKFGRLVRELDVQRRLGAWKTREFSVQPRKLSRSDARAALVTLLPAGGLESSESSKEIKGLICLLKSSESSKLTQGPEDDITDEGKESASQCGLGNSIKTKPENMHAKIEEAGNSKVNVIELMIADPLDGEACGETSSKCESLKATHVKTDSLNQNLNMYFRLISLILLWHLKTGMLWLPLKCVALSEKLTGLVYDDVDGSENYGAQAKGKRVCVSNEANGEQVAGESVRFTMKVLTEENLETDGKDGNSARNIHIGCANEGFSSRNEKEAKGLREEPICKTTDCELKHSYINGHIAADLGATDGQKKERLQVVAENGVTSEQDVLMELSRQLKTENDDQPYFKLPAEGVTMHASVGDATVEVDVKLLDSGDNCKIDTLDESTGVQTNEKTGSAKQDNISGIISHTLKEKKKTQVQSTLSIQNPVVMLPRYRLNSVRPFCLIHEVYDCEQYIPGGECYSTVTSCRLSQMGRNIAIRTGGKLKPPPSRRDHSARTFGRFTCRRSPQSMPTRNSCCVVDCSVPDGSPAPERQIMSTRHLPLPHHISINKVNGVVLISSKNNAGRPVHVHGVSVQGGGLQSLTAWSPASGAQWRIAPADDITVVSADGRTYRNPPDRGNSTPVDVNSGGQLWRGPLCELNQKLGDGKLSVIHTAIGEIKLVTRPGNHHGPQRLKRVEAMRRLLFSDGEVVAFRESKNIMTVIGAVSRPPTVNAVVPNRVELENSLPDRESGHPGYRHTDEMAGNCTSSAKFAARDASSSASGRSSDVHSDGLTPTNTSATGNCRTSNRPLNASHPGRLRVAIKPGGAGSSSVLQLQGYHDHKRNGSGSTQMQACEQQSEENRQRCTDPARISLILNHSEPGFPSRLNSSKHRRLSFEPAAIVPGSDSVDTGLCRRKRWRSTPSVICEAFREAHTAEGETPVMQSIARSDKKSTSAKQLTITSQDAANNSEAYTKNSGASDVNVKVQSRREKGQTASHAVKLDELIEHKTGAAELYPHIISKCNSPQEVDESLLKLSGASAERQASAEKQNTRTEWVRSRLAEVRDNRKCSTLVNAQRKRSYETEEYKTKDQTEPPAKRSFIPNNSDNIRLVDEKHGCKGTETEKCEIGQDCLTSCAQHTAAPALKRSFRTELKRCFKPEAPQVLHPLDSPVKSTSENPSAASSESRAFSSDEDPSLTVRPGGTADLCQEHISTLSKRLTPVVDMWEQSMTIASEQSDVLPKSPSLLLDGPDSVTTETTSSDGAASSTALDESAPTQVLSALTEQPLATQCCWF